MTSFRIAAGALCIALAGSLPSLSSTLVHSHTPCPAISAVPFLYDEER